jgi:hypothetical protein
MHIGSRCILCNRDSDGARGEVQRPRSTWEGGKAVVQRRGSVEWVLASDLGDDAH